MQNPPEDFKIEKVGILTKQSIKPFVPLIKQLVDFLEVKKGKEVLLDEHIASFLKRGKGLNKSQILKQIDLGIAFGGDGTLLRTARSLGKKRVFILGINAGRLGFLTESYSSETFQALEKIFKGKYKLDRRSLLRVTIYRKKIKIKTFLALNEAVISQGKLARLITLKAEINQRKVALFQGDGLIVATPTGSTGHALSAGGPIVNPALEAFVVNPICPVSLSNRSIILPNDRQLKITVEAKRREEDYEIGLTLDGQVAFSLKDGDEIKIRKSSRRFYLIRFTEGKYYRMLRDKLGWGKI